MASKKKEPKPVFLAHIHLKGGQSIPLKVYSVEIGHDDAGSCVSYKVEAHPDENLSQLFIEPNQIAAIHTVLMATEPVLEAPTPITRVK